jgi:hypothetical protein
MTRITSLKRSQPRVVLAYRVDAGIHVKLMWAPDTKTVAVHVWDSRRDERFELVIEPELNPIDVYDHPYAYAAWRGLDFGPGRLPEAA